jgi:hypothetical protein
MTPKSNYEKTTDALLVLIKTPHIKTYLQQNDPKALEQAEEALKDYNKELAKHLNNNIID